jgi:hypothetical protein
MNFKEFLLNEVSTHARDQITVRIRNAANANSTIIPNADALINQALKNVEIAEIIYRGPKTYAVEILPTFNVLVGGRQAWPIPRTPQEAKALPDFMRGAHGSVGNMLVAILEPPVAGVHKREPNQLNTSTIMFSRGPEIPIIANQLNVDKLIRYDKFLQDAQMKQGMVGKANRLGLTRHQI